MNVFTYWNEWATVTVDAYVSSSSPSGGSGGEVCRLRLHLVSVFHAEFAVSMCWALMLVICISISKRVDASFTPLCKTVLFRLLARTASRCRRDYILPLWFLLSLVLLLFDA